MPEVQPATTLGLLKYLLSVPEYQYLREGVHYIPGAGCTLDYGMRGQFWLPVHPTEMERLLMCAREVKYEGNGP